MRMIPRLGLHLVLMLALLLGMPLLVQAGSFEDGVKASEQGDFTSAVTHYRKAAEQGDTRAQYLLAALYNNGKGVPQDYTEAVKWYRKAAEQGLAPAQYDLGVAYDEGEGVPQNYTEAVKWYRKAAEQGFASAQSNLGVYYGTGYGVPQDYIEAYKWANLSAATGLSNAIKLRNELARLMTPQQIAEGQRKSREWKPKQ